MKKKSLILLIPLLFLFVMPSNVNAYSISSESITSFSETIENDVLFMPDSVDYDQQTATAGTATGATIEGDYTNTSADDSSYYKTARAGAGLLSMTLNFTHTLPQIETTQEGTLTVDINHNEVASTAEMCYIYNFTLGGWDSGVDTSGGDGYFNFTLTEDHILNGLTRVKANETAGAGGSYLWIDYALSSIDMITRLNNGSYVETCSDISEWGEYGTTWESDEAISGNGDVLNITKTGDSNNDYDGYTASITCDSADYLEFRVQCNTTSVETIIFYLMWSGGDAYKGTGAITSTSWLTFRWHFDSFSSGPVELPLDQIMFYIRTDTGIDAQVLFDYIRIFRGNESGYQHDMSTTEYTDHNLMSYSSDGDHIRAEFLGGGPDGSLEINIDESSTWTNIDPDYYPFLSWYCVNITNDYSVQVVTSGGPQTVYTDISDTGLVHANVRAVTSDDYYTIWFILDGTAEIISLDWVKAYSIANFTITQGANTVNDFMYVDSNDDIIFERTTATYFILDLDPTISTVPVNTYDTWTLGISNIGSDVGASYDWRPRFYNGTVWQDSAVDNDQTTGDFTITGNCTDFKFVNYESLTLSTVLFIDSHDWYDISEADFVLWVPFSAEQEFLFDTLLILFGLALMPIGTTYLATKKDDMTADTFYIGIMCILFGFALFVGVIMT